MIPSIRFFTRTVNIYKQGRDGLALTGLTLTDADVPSSPLWPFDTDYEPYEISKTFRNMYVIYTGATIIVHPGDYVDVDGVMYEINRVNRYNDFLELQVYAEVV